jgi:ABC-type molybdate transport system substrate-binding protein
LGAQWTELAKKAVVTKPTVNEIANDLKLGSADAGILFSPLVAQYGEMEIVAVPELAGVKANVAAGILKVSTNPTMALAFARYIAAKDRGAKVLKETGYEPLGHEAWAFNPELKLFAGAMLRPAIEKTLADFEKREGVKITTVYNGCGILVGQMKTGEKPDAYFACEPSFMKEVKDIFLDSEDISTNRLVILVPKANPHGIKSLRDLAKPGIRLGFGHEKQCALGALTKTTLIQDGTYEAVQKNVAVQAPTGDLLVNQLRTGSLDAVVAYVSNAVGSGDLLSAIAVDLPCAIAAQPLAPSRETAYPETARRLIDALKTDESRRRFESQGFHWAK